MTRPIITLLTDFGRDSPYVAAMKGVILSIQPAATLVDLTHGIPPQDVRAGAIALDQAAPWFPPETIHVAVVDPGVGSGRRIVYAQLGSWHFLAPDNGLLSRLAQRFEPLTIRTVTDRQYWLPTVSATFHGRDIFAPVAARLSAGLEPDRLGPEQAEIITLDWPEVLVAAGKLEGRIESIDSFGNLITNIPAEKLVGVPRGETVTIECDEHQTQGIFNTYSDQPPMTLIALVGSHERLELAIVGDSAAIMLGIRVGTPVKVTW